MSVYVRNWARQLTRIENPCFIFNDNESAIRIMSTYTNQGRSRHFSIKLRYIVHLVTNGILQLEYLKSSDNIADLFTHTLGPQKFARLCGMLYQTTDAATYGLVFYSGGESRSLEKATIATQQEIRALLVGISNSYQ